MSDPNFQELNRQFPTPDGAEGPQVEAQQVGAETLPGANDIGGVAVGAETNAEDAIANAGANNAEQAQVVFGPSLTAVNAPAKSPGRLDLSVGLGESTKLPDPANEVNSAGEVPGHRTGWTPPENGLREQPTSQDPDKT